MLKLKIVEFKYRHALFTGVVVDDKFIKFWNPHYNCVDSIFISSESLAGFEVKKTNIDLFQYLLTIPFIE